MTKKCIICGEAAEFNIKDTSDYYCPDCALENFGDISYLQKVSEEVKALKEVIEERINGDDPTDILEDDEQD
ncbi:MAG: hypothetical protein ABIJ08_00050 [Nanoarchaeota archaeon]